MKLNNKLSLPLSTAHSTFPRKNKGAHRVEIHRPRQNSIRYITPGRTHQHPYTTSQSKPTHHTSRTPFSTRNTMLLIITACLATLCTCLAVVHQRHSLLLTPHFYILHATTSIAFSTALYNMDAEPWAYLLGFAGLSLYAVVRTFHRKYRGGSLNKNVSDRNNRRARRRER